MKYYAVLIGVVLTTTMVCSAPSAQNYQNQQQSNQNIFGIRTTRPPQDPHYQHGLRNTVQPRPGVGPFGPGQGPFGGYTVDYRTQQHNHFGNGIMRGCICDMTLNVVCGSNGRSYPNICELNCEILKNPNLRFVHYGECR